MAATEATRIEFSIGVCQSVNLLASVEKHSAGMLNTMVRTGTTPSSSMPASAYLTQPDELTPPCLKSGAFMGTPDPRSTAPLSSRSPNPGICRTWHSCLAGT